MNIDNVDEINAHKTHNAILLLLIKIMMKIDDNDNESSLIAKQ